MDEVQHQNFDHYPNFNKFFTRQLKDGVRIIEDHSNEKTMCSPCDGKITACGVIDTA
jgi:phosphatidylserine decarboxylase